MNDKIKTTIVIDRRLWEEFKSRVGAEGRLRSLSQAVEEALKDEISDLLAIKMLEQMLSEGEPPLIVEPVKPRIDTDAGRVIREMRESRH